MASRIFAAIYDPLMHRFEPQGVRDVRGSLVADLTGDVLEIGAGTGANFEHYVAAARVTATDYSPHMVKRARRRAAQVQADVTVREANVEALPFTDGQFDHAIATLVFCSVDNPAAGLAEIRRVTKAGGAVRLLEHVGADGSRARRLQNWLTPLWRRVNDGCHLDRDTVQEVERAGFEVEGVASVPNTPRLIPMRVIRARVPIA